MQTITRKQYEAIAPEYRSVWTSERTDWQDWDKVRSQYMGKRTMMSGDGSCSLLIEGLSFTIIG